MPGDSVVRHLVENAATHLDEGGWCQILANWAHRDGTAWRGRARGVVRRQPPRCVGRPARARRPVGVRRDVARRWGLSGSPTTSSAMTAGSTGSPRSASRRSGSAGSACARRPRRRCDRFEEWTGEVAPPVGPAVAAWGRRTELLRGLSDDALLERAFRQAPDLVEETRGPVGAEHPESIVLRLQQGVRRSRQVDTIEAGLVSASEGDLTAGQILDALPRCCSATRPISGVRTRARCANSPPTARPERHLHWP